VHRDVKPGNIFIRSDGVVKLADFGVARLSHTPQLTRPRGAIGTLHMVTEQAGGEPVGSASDMYALGSTLYELLIGTHRLPMTRPRRGSMHTSVRLPCLCGVCGP
jgi:serine/threonine-protein kinase